MNEYLVVFELFVFHGTNERKTHLVSIETSKYGVCGGERESLSRLSYLKCRVWYIRLDVFLCVYIQCRAKEHLLNCSFWLEEERASVPTHA